ncbi:hypothetical protein PGH43_04155 [Legionella pneumophila 130b]|nr:hypothetical protein PGH43_04155 [Legionella pneumophila 130b]
MIEQHLRPLYQRLCVNPITPVLIERVTQIKSPSFLAYWVF